MTTKILKAIEEFEAVRAKAKTGKWKFINDPTCEYFYIHTSEWTNKFHDHQRDTICATKPDFEFITQAANNATKFTQALKVAVEALEKIEDPRKRDHQEPDKYTEVGCMMNMASEVLIEIERILEEQK